MGVKRKSELFFLILAMNIILTPNFMVFIASTTEDSGSVNRMEANVVWERTYGGAEDDRAFYAAVVADGFVVYALILSAAVIFVLIVVFLLVRRYVNQKITERN
jgi:hypothetical protein